MDSSSTVILARQFPEGVAISVLSPMRNFPGNFSRRLIRKFIIVASGVALTGIEAVPPAEQRNKSLPERWAGIFARETGLTIPRGVFFFLRSYRAPAVYGCWDHARGYQPEGESEQRFLGHGSLGKLARVFSESRFPLLTLFCPVFSRPSSLESHYPLDLAVRNSRGKTRVAPLRFQLEAH